MRIKREVIETEGTDHAEIADREAEAAEGKSKGSKRKRQTRPPPEAIVKAEEMSEGVQVEEVEGVTSGGVKKSRGKVKREKAAEKEEWESDEAGERQRVRGAKCKREKPADGQAKTMKVLCIVYCVCVCVCVSVCTRMQHRTR
jgi:cobalamin biosynthesis Mg chelatase CobN